MPENFPDSSTATLVRDELDDWLSKLATTQARVKSVDVQGLSTEQAAGVTEADKALTELAEKSKKIDWLLYEMASYITRLELQRQTARKAFDAGYDARFKDVIAQLSTREYKELLQALGRSTTDDDISF